MKNIDFVGGTLVEYKAGTDTRLEFARGTITRFHYKKRKYGNNEFSIDTEESDRAGKDFDINVNLFPKLGSAHVYSSGCHDIEERNGIWYFETGPWISHTCAIAPKGVEIEQKEIYDREKGGIQ